MFFFFLKKPKCQPKLCTRKRSRGLWSQQQRRVRFDLGIPVEEESLVERDPKEFCSPSSESGQIHQKMHLFSRSRWKTIQRISHLHICHQKYKQVFEGQDKGCGSLGHRRTSLAGMDERAWHPVQQEAF